MFSNLAGYGAQLAVQWALQGLTAHSPSLKSTAGSADVAGAELAAAELADVALMWQTVELESRAYGRRRARTSVSSLRSSGESSHVKEFH